MPTVRTVNISPNLPERLKPLLAIANNLWWTWTPEAIYLFQDMDRDVWERSGHNPVAMLGMIEQPRLEELERDEIFLARLDEIYSELERYLKSKTWHKKQLAEGKQSEGLIAYFSAEFGLHECLPLYSGGLGILAGDFMKSASDLGLPLVGIGLLYKHGYFQQYLNTDGWQLETYPSNDFYNMPLKPLKGSDGEPVTVQVEMDGRVVYARAWSIAVGRVEIYMLDTDVLSNSQADRQITSYLYGGGLETRIQQEIILGMGGIKLLMALGLTPTVCHMNEGHSAFMAIERLIQLMQNDGLSYTEAVEAVRSTSIFTTHTPVQAGIDRFPPEMIRRYFTKTVEGLGIDMEEFLGLGRINPSDPTEAFSMAVLAIKMASKTNGVSKLHSEVSRKMWANIWPQIPQHEVPITHITNGIHTLGWMSSEMARLYQRYLGTRWIDEPTDHAIWKRVEQIPAFEIWRSRERMIETLISFARTRLKKQLQAKGLSSYQIEKAEEVLDPEALTIGFARRFATYKRAALLFKDLERLKKILTDPERPVQIIFSGKAHPQDKLGKELIHQVVQTASLPEFRNHIVFIENYDIEVARHLVQGVDVWLNTPRRPNEASGTSGMKVTANGGINLSILDGWWVEGYKDGNGWAIGSGEEYQDHEYQDEVESRLLYELLENSVVPLFYKRNVHGIPDEWIEIIKNSIKTICPFFNTNRMVEDYAKQFYLPNTNKWRILKENNWNELKSLTLWKQNIIKTWPNVRILEIRVPLNDSIKVGDRLPISAIIDLAGLDPNEIRAEAYLGRLDEKGEISLGSPLPLLPSGENEGSAHIFKGNLLCLSSGQIGFSVRCYPYRKELGHKFEMGLLTWN
ncbi:alpha-glucan family phosphorylase [Dissulfurimicrobium hydrothermale]|uniref:alpha-glucan family phosphorylase n=1 Tax=Dissulfurimicrobium hydrothermale TaxID=1750598 RepID=UPI001EDADE53|nr:alpha-glucan family phosphorylase [Dissulfurimicrobium hydrothermale]UKL12940.1 alpha-glucan family phosphorylase [Dissulfurimicrobium hydrothermale]